MERVRFPIDGVVYHSAAETADYVANGAWVWSTFGDELRAAAREKPDQPCIIADDGVFTFAQLDALSESLARCLLEIALRLATAPSSRSGPSKSSSSLCSDASRRPCCLSAHCRNTATSRSSS